MKVKLLVFPAVLAVSIIILITYVWPEIGALKKTNSDLAGSKAILENILEKKSKMENLKNSLGQNQDKENFVLDFLPLEKNEEGIINGINYLATNSGASLTNLTLEEDKNPVVKDDLNAVDSKGVLFSSSEVNAGSQTGQSAGVKMRFVKSKISLAGNYENIKTFLEDLYKMEMFNSVDSILISKQESGQFQGANIDQNSNTLYSDIEVSFAYLPRIKINGDYSPSIFGQSSFDFSAYNKLNSLVSKKIPKLEVGEEGRSNPFLP